MSYAPVIPASGYAGWLFLKRTMATQQTVFEKGEDRQRDETYFREKIGGITSAEALVADKRLLRVALGAFGLQADLGNGYFIRKVLEDGTLNTGALANKLSNKQYMAFSAAFGFGDFNTPRTKLSTFAAEILEKYRDRSFEAAVGEVNGDMRVALHAERELGTLAASSLSEDGKWFTVMGAPPLRKLFETAFGLPSSFGALDIDRQLAVLKEKAQAFGDGTMSQFARAEVQEKLIRQFLVRAELAGGAAAPGRAAGALQILQAGQSRWKALRR
ncbi:MAG: DUF1217 domain-containing protein [Gemmobacter sp.]|jgi:hypothetical protein|nr:DUF1217 domain-containing protein [Gemmobacter sp.]